MIRRIRNDNEIRTILVPLTDKSVDTLREFWEVKAGSVAIQLTILKFIEWIESDDMILLILSDEKIMNIIKKRRSNIKGDNQNETISESA